MAYSRSRITEESAWTVPRRFRVLHTPVTFAPNHFTICTANVPTPPAAPFSRTFYPASIRALSRRPCNAVSAAIGAEAACSNATLSGLMTSAGYILADRFYLASQIHAGAFELRLAQPKHQAHDEWPALHQFPVQRVDGAARTLIRTSSCPGTGLSTFRHSRTAG